MIFIPKYRQRLMNHDNAGGESNLLSRSHVSSMTGGCTWPIYYQEVISVEKGSVIIRHQLAPLSRSHCCNLLFQRRLKTRFTCPSIHNFTCKKHIWIPEVHVVTRHRKTIYVWRRVVVQKKGRTMNWKQAVETKEYMA